MTDTTPPRSWLVLDLDRDGWTDGLQLNMAQLDENGSGTGYRLHGPKYNGSSKNLIRHELNEQDAAEIRAMLDAVFPTPAPDVASLWQQLADTMNALEAAGAHPTPQNGVYIGPRYGPWAYDPDGLCVVHDENTSRWIVEDRTRRCAECREPVADGTGAYCSTRCRNAADRHDTPAGGDGDE